MPWNLLLLPLLGGFWFVSILYGTRFAAIQASRDRLFFFSATAGLVLAFAARTLILVVTFSYTVVDIPSVDIPFLAWIHYFKREFLPWPYAGTAVLAALLGPIAATSFNIIHRKIHLGKWRVSTDEKMHFRDLLNEKALLKSGDQFERMVTTWLHNIDNVLIALKSGKVYVGIIAEAPPNIDGRCPWITIAPYYSGFRDPTTKRVTLDTSYMDVIEEFVKESSSPGPSEHKDSYVSQEDFLRVIRTEDIETAGKFSARIWNKFQDAKQTAKPVRRQNDLSGGPS